MIASYYPSVGRNTADFAEAVALVAFVYAVCHLLYVRIVVARELRRSAGMSSSSRGRRATARAQRPRPGEGLRVVGREERAPRTGLPPRLRLVRRPDDPGDLRCAQLRERPGAVSRRTPSGNHSEVTR